jgi:hypothetical protein
MLFLCLTRPFPHAGCCLHICGKGKRPCWIPCHGQAERLPATTVRKLRPSGVRVEDFDLASCYTAALDSRVGGDQGDVEGFGQGDVLSVVGGQVGMKALQARPQGQHVLPFDGELAVRRRQGDRGPRGRATGSASCSPRRRSCAAWAPQYEPPMRWPTCPANPKQSRNAGYPHVPYETWPRSEKLGSRMAAGRPPWS